MFGVVYAGFDTYAGLATGTVVRCAQDLSTAEQTGVLLAVKGLFNGPIIGVLYIVGTAAWTLGAGAVAYTLLAGRCVTRAGPVNHGCGALAVRRSSASVRPDHVRCGRCGARLARMAEYGDDRREKGLNGGEHRQAPELLEKHQWESGLS